MRHLGLTLTLLFIFPFFILPHAVKAADSGRLIDIYTQHPAPYGGQGPNQPSNPFRPLMEISLYANVTFNQWPIAQKTVTLEIRHGASKFMFSNPTNSNGQIVIKFVIPWLGSDTRTQVLGIWNVTATVEIAGIVVTDTLWFYATLADINTDGAVNNKDLAIVMASYGTKPTSEKWNPAADVNYDGKIDMRDLAIIAKNLGWHM